MAWSPAQRLFLRLLPILGLALPSCLIDDEVSTVSFVAMALPARVAAGDSAEVDLAYVIGPQSCFETERIEVTVERSLIRITGTGVRAPDRGCGDTTSTGRSVVRTPSLAPGDYTVVAGDLRETLTVAGDTPGTRDHLVCAVRYHPRDGGCELVGYDMIVALSGFPADLDTGRHYLVRADIGADDPCDFARHGPVDYFAVVREMTPLD